MILLLLNLILGDACVELSHTCDHLIQTCHADYGRCPKADRCIESFEEHCGIKWYAAVDTVRTQI